MREGLNTTLEKIAILLKVRQLAAANDVSFAKKWAARKLAIEQDPTELSRWANFPTYPTAKDKDVGEFCTKVTSQLALYQSKKGAFARDWVMAAATGMPSYLACGGINTVVACLSCRRLPA